jgi:putative oxidoreductase
VIPNDGWFAVSTSPPEDHTVAQPALARTYLAFALALVFLAAGASKLIDHHQAVLDFTRWGLPAPGALSIAVGLFEIAGAALLMAGVATRAVASALAVEMILALIVAGPVDGGVQLVMPSALAALCLGLAWVSRPARRETG